MDNQTPNNPETHQSSPETPRDPEYDTPGAMPTPAHPNSSKLPKWLTAVILVIIAISLGFFTYNSLTNKQSAPSENKCPLMMCQYGCKDSKCLSPTPAPNAAVADPTADWKTYIHPEVGYTIKYPGSWKGGTDSTPEAIIRDYKDFSITSPDYKITTEGITHLANGAIIFIRLKKTSETSIETIFKADPLIPTIAQNQKRTTINGQPAIQYDYSYESVNATDTIFIRDGIKFLIKLQYPNIKDKNQYWDIYQQMLNTFKFTEKTSPTSVPPFACPTEPTCKENERLMVGDPAPDNPDQCAFYACN